MRIELRNHLEKSPTGNPAEDFQPYLDTYLIDASRNVLGGILILPGGGYHHRAFHEGEPVARKFNELGYHAFVLQYRVAPYRYPDPIRDVARAIKLIRSHEQEWYLGKLATLGFSAGGHLAAAGAMAADTVNCDEGDKADAASTAIDAMILCYPVISFCDEFGHTGSGQNLCGSVEAGQQSDVADMHLAVNDSTPPAFLWHSATDGCVPVCHSTEFAKSMWQSGKKCELHVFPHAPHGKGLGLGLKDICVWPELAAQFLETTAGFTRA